MEVKNLSQPMQDKLSEMLADDIKVVSFDIFETLLVRPVTHPHDIWQLVGKISGIPNFRHQRMIAATESRRYIEFPNEDHVLNRIYDTYARIFNATSEEANKLMQLEMDVEFRLLYARNSVKCIYEEVRKAGKEIILVSDMYLSSDFIRKVLDKNGYIGYSTLYVSGEVGLTKHSGNLFHKITGDFHRRGIKPHEIIHVGDNHTADVNNAKKAGLNGVFVRGAYSVFKSKKRLKAYGGLAHHVSDNTFLIGMLANFIFDDPYIHFDNDSRYNGDANFFGYTLAPFFISFLHWMMKEAKSDGIEQLVLVYRDGYLPRKMYEILKPYVPDFDMVSLYLSRAVRRGHFSKSVNGLYENLKSTRFEPDMTVSEFIRNRMMVSDTGEYTEAFKIFMRKGYTNDKDAIGQLNKIVPFLHELEPFFSCALWHPLHDISRISNAGDFPIYA